MTRDKMSNKSKQGDRKVSSAPSGSTGKSSKSHNNENSGDGSYGIQSAYRVDEIIPNDPLAIQDALSDLSNRTKGKKKPEPESSSTAKSSSKKIDKPNALAHIDLNNFAGVVIADDMPEVTLEDPIQIMTPDEGFQEVVSKKTQKERLKQQQEEEFRRANERKKREETMKAAARHVNNNHEKTRNTKLPPRFNKQNVSKPQPVALTNGNSASSMTIGVWDATVVNAEVNKTVPETVKQPPPEEKKALSQISLPPPPSVNAWDKPLQSQPAMPAPVNTTAVPLASTKAAVNVVMATTSTGKDSKPKQEPDKPDFDQHDSGIDLSSDHHGSNPSSQRSSPSNEIKTESKLEGELVEKLNDKIREQKLQRSKTGQLSDSKSKIVGGQLKSQKAAAPVDVKPDTEKANERPADLSNEGTVTSKTIQGTALVSGGLGDIGTPATSGQASVSLDGNIAGDIALSQSLSGLEDTKKEMTVSSHSPVSPSADLTLKIASAKRVWETALPPVIEQAGSSPNMTDQAEASVSTATSSYGNFSAVTSLEDSVPSVPRSSVPTDTFGSFLPHGSSESPPVSIHMSPRSFSAFPGNMAAVSSTSAVDNMVSFTQSTGLNSASVGGPYSGNLAFASVPVRPASADQMRQLEIAYSLQPSSGGISADLVGSGASQTLFAGSNGQPYMFQTDSPQRSVSSIGMVQQPAQAAQGYTSSYQFGLSQQPPQQHPLYGQIGAPQQMQPTTTQAPASRNIASMLTSSLAQQPQPQQVAPSQPYQGYSFSPVYTQAPILSTTVTMSVKPPVPPSTYSLPSNTKPVSHPTYGSASSATIQPSQIYAPNQSLIGQQVMVASPIVALQTGMQQPQPQPQPQQQPPQPQQQPQPQQPSSMYTPPPQHGSTQFFNSAQSASAAVQAGSIQVPQAGSPVQYTQNYSGTQPPQGMPVNIPGSVIGQPTRQPKPFTSAPIVNVGVHSGKPVGKMSPRASDMNQHVDAKPFSPGRSGTPPGTATSTPSHSPIGHSPKQGQGQGQMATIGHPVQVFSQAPTVNQQKFANAYGSVNMPRGIRPQMAVPRHPSAMLRPQSAIINYPMGGLVQGTVPPTAGAPVRYPAPIQRPSVQPFQNIVQQQPPQQNQPQPRHQINPSIQQQQQGPGKGASSNKQSPQHQPPNSKTQLEKQRQDVLASTKAFFTQFGQQPTKQSEKKEESAEDAGKQDSKKEETSSSESKDAEQIKGNEQAPKS